MGLFHMFPDGKTAEQLFIIHDLDDGFAEQSGLS